MKPTIPSEGGHAAQPADPSWNPQSAAGPDVPPSHGPAGALRIVGRPDLLTAQKVEVSIILQAMLGTTVAAQYLADNEVEMSVSVRVLTQPSARRGRHDANGIAC